LLELIRGDKLFQQNLDHLLTLVSEEYENEPERTDDDVDKIFAVASQQFESTSASNERFEKHTFSADIRDLIHSGIPDKTQKTTWWALRGWREWAVYRQDNQLDEDEKHVELLEEFVLMKESDQAFWLCRFVCLQSQASREAAIPS